MQRFRLALCAALTVLAGLAPAIVMAPPIAEAQVSERTIFDATVVAIPPATVAPCVLLESGRLTARAALTGHPAPQPVTLHLTGYQGDEPVVGANLAVGRDETSATLPLTGGLVCWTVAVSPTVDVNVTDPAERSAYVQYVALKLTLTPE